MSSLISVEWFAIVVFSLLQGVSQQGKLAQIKATVARYPDAPNHVLHSSKATRYANAIG
jgi:hypothetical protein